MGLALRAAPLTYRQKTLRAPLRPVSQGVPALPVSPADDQLSGSVFPSIPSGAQVRTTGRLSPPRPWHLGRPDSGYLLPGIESRDRHRLYPGTLSPDLAWTGLLPGQYFSQLRVPEW